MKKGFLILSVLVFTVCNLFNVIASDDLPRTELVDKANGELLRLGKIDEDYFKLYSKKNKYPLSTNQYLTKLLKNQANFV